MSSINQNEMAKQVSAMNISGAPKSSSAHPAKYNKKYEVPATLIISPYFDGVTRNVHKRPMPWEGFFNAGLITEEEMITFRSLQQSKRNFKDYPIETRKCTNLVLGLLVKLHRIEVIQYLLVLLDDLVENQDTAIDECISYKSDRYATIYTLLEKNFESHDDYIGLMACKVIIKLLNSQNSYDFSFDFTNLFVYFEQKLDSTDPSISDVVIQLIQSVLSINGSRKFIFHNSPSCLEKMVLILKDTVLSPNQHGLKVSVAQTQKYDIIPTLVKIARSTLKEKVIRVMIFTIKNMFDLSLESNLPSIVVSGVQSCLIALSGRKIQDADLSEVISDLSQKLSEKLEKETTWDEYMNELKSGMLSWSQVHSSDAFWKMNYEKFNQEDHLGLKILSELISDSNNDPLIIAVACHDLGQYIKHYPNGKAILTKLGAKAHLMQLMTHPDDKVRYEALTSVQEFMVNAWKNQQVDPIY
ncbi:V-type proton ATPase subunit H [Smittium culicis]|uniref:V-type proton ATPase subunit H n=2 Tax=Smittium culicis TaxID=133412 RepID=A0A1R1XZ79_9FUNG|nr:V-type proton ATPase subunit H [Smittium culicis]